MIRYQLRLVASLSADDCEWTDWTDWTVVSCQQQVRDSGAGGQ